MHPVLRIDVVRHVGTRTFGMLSEGLRGVPESVGQGRHVEERRELLERRVSGALRIDTKGGEALLQGGD